MIKKVLLSLQSAFQKELIVKRICSYIIIVVMMSIQPAFGQIVYTSEDQGYHPRASGDPDEIGVMVPIQNVQHDQFKYEFAPIGDGLLLLIGLGGGYLLKKKKSKKQ